MQATFMRVLTWLLRAALFLAMMGFALSNTEPATLRFFGIPDEAWRAPMVVILFVFFTAGVLVGVLATLPALVRQRRQIATLQRAASTRSTAADPAAPSAAAEGGAQAARAEVGMRGI